MLSEDNVRVLEAQEGLLCVHYSWWGDGRWPKYRVPIVVCACNVSVLRLKGLVLFCELFVRRSVWGFISSREVLGPGSVQSGY